MTTHVGPLVSGNRFVSAGGAESGTTAGSSPACCRCYRIDSKPTHNLKKSTAAAPAAAAAAAVATRCWQNDMRARPTFITANKAYPQSCSYAPDHFYRFLTYPGL